MKQAHLVIIGIALCHLTHKALVGAVSLRLGRPALSWPVKYLEAREIVPFLCRRQFRGACWCRQRKLVQDGSCLVRRLLVPDRMIVHHGLAPVSHRKFRIDLLCALKLRFRERVLEQVQ
jgi:hypothetical protein